MRYWWVNQSQTFRHELAGGHLWSPKRNANEARNPFYESMREVSPGDIIFSFVDTGAPWPSFEDRHLASDAVLYPWRFISRG